jgi:hypothetical protein
MLLKLLRHPQSTISALVNEPSATWALPIVGFFFLSFAEGYGRVVSLRPAWPAVVLILVTALAALVIGSWTWAGIFGGLLHLSARLLRGQEGASKTIRAVGYAFFWPGVLAAAASVAIILLGYRGDDFPPAAIAPLLLQLCAGFWGIYTVVAALRATHGFGWGRAVLAYLLPFIVLLAIAVMILVATNAFNSAQVQG